MIATISRKDYNFNIQYLQWQLANAIARPLAIELAAFVINFFLKLIIGVQARNLQEGVIKSCVQGGHKIFSRGEGVRGPCWKNKIIFGIFC